MRRVLLVLGLLGFGSCPAFAQQPPSPEALQAATELAASVSVNLKDRMAETLTAQLWPQIESQTNGQVDAATLAEMHAEFTRVVSVYVAASMKDVPALYAKYFNTTEIRDLMAFYDTPSGKKALVVLPRLITEYDNTLMPPIDALQRDLGAAMDGIMQKHAAARN